MMSLISIPSSFQSEKQREFYEKRYKFLKNHFPVIERKVAVEGKDFLGVNAYDEKKKFKVLDFQNRLFNTLPFEVSEGFTSFRKKLKSVTMRFDEFISPIDEELQHEINYYFEETNLPSTYFEDRNGLVGRDFSTKFSFLSCGALDVRYLYNKIKDYEQRVVSNKSTYWLVFELLWREFFYWHSKASEST